MKVVKVAQTLALILVISSSYCTLATKAEVISVNSTTQASSDTTRAISIPHAIDWQNLSPSQQQRYLELNSFLTQFTRTAELLKYVDDTSEYVQKTLKGFKSKTLDQKNKLAIAGKKNLSEAVEELFKDSPAVLMFNSVLSLDTSDKLDFFNEVASLIKSSKFDPSKSLLKKLIGYSRLDRTIVSNEINNHLVGSGEPLAMILFTTAEEFKAFNAHIKNIRTAAQAQIAHKTTGPARH